MTLTKGNSEEYRHGLGGSAIGAVDGKLTVSNSSFVGNRKGYLSGGAIFVGQGVTLDVNNSTFSDNRAAGGGGAVATKVSTMRGIVPSYTTLTHVTIVPSRVAGKGLGFNIWVDPSDVNFKLRNSLIVDKKDSYREEGSSCQGPLSENIGNLIEDGSCASMVGGDPMLAETTGSPAHFPLLDGSPALDSADQRFCLDSDQLGTPRPQGGGCDIGAFESSTALPKPAPVLPPPPCPLAQQITAANTDAAAGACPAGDGADTITLARNISISQQLPPITSEITIEGNGYTLSGNGSFRLLDVDGGALTIRDLTLADGNASVGGAIRLRNGARVSVTNLRFRDNEATEGGAIATVSDDVWLHVERSSFIGNWAADDGGALLADGGAVNVANSSFQGNAAGKFGGAIASRRGRVEVSNSTLSGNEANEGGGIHINGAYTTLTHLTLMNNRAYHIVGAGIYHHSGTLNLRNSIVAGSGSGDDCFGDLDESRGNFSQDGTCSTAIIADPLLAERTGAHYPLLNASPAHGAADPAFCLPTDQLGNPRPHCDIGAIESERTASEEPPPARVIAADCTLADQIIAANTDAPAGTCPAGQGADTIRLRASIVLDAPLPPITSQVTIDGKGYTVDGDNRFRVFEVVGGQAVIKNLTLINGRGSGEDGGAIYARTDAEILISQVTFTNNTAKSGGAVAVHGGRAGIYNSHFLGNSAEDKGGAIWFDATCYDIGNLELEGNSSTTRRPYWSGIDERDTPSGCGAGTGILVRDK